LCDLLIASHRAPDTAASEYLHGRKTLSRPEKAAVSALAFSMLRIKGFTDRILTRMDPESLSSAGRRADRRRFTAAALIALHEAGIPEKSILDIIRPLPAAEIAAMFLARHANLGVREAEEFSRFAKAEAARILTAAQLTAAAGTPPEERLEDIAASVCVQPWMLKAWALEGDPPRGWAWARTLGGSLRESAPVCLRVNLSLRSRDDMLARLRDAGIDAEASSLSPAGVIPAERTELRRFADFQEGAFEIQDIGSQLVSYAAGAAPGMAIHDACAGAGGKSLHLADITRDSARIVAEDIEPARLRALGHRARRCGFASIETRRPAGNTRSRGSGFTSARETFDIVLVDAPCSGTGTARRNPRVKWRCTPALVRRMSAKQLDLLSQSARGTRIGGVLLYATCSLMPEENDGVASAFLRSNPDFAPDPLPPVFASQGISVPGLAPDAWKCSLTPSEHSCDGFFIARFRRIG